jgi:hypothetical protein
MDDLTPETNGYSTILKIAEHVVLTYVDIVQHPDKYGVSDVNEVDLAMSVADASGAFYRLPISPKLVGVQCARVAGYTIVPMCCTFDWKRSAGAFSHITASILAIHKSDVRNATVLKPEFKPHLDPVSEQHFDAVTHSAAQQSERRKLANDVFPDHIRTSDGHVDDFGALALVKSEAAIGAVADLAFAITSHLGLGSVSAKKFAQSSFWSSLQKIIGAWFAMPHEKI